MNQKFDPKAFLRSVQKNVHTALTGEEAQEDLVANIQAQLKKLDPKSREQLIRSQPEVRTLETIAQINSMTAERIHEEMLAAVSGAGWLMSIMGDVSIEQLNELLQQQLPALDAQVKRQETKLRNARIKSAAAHNADMLLKIAPDELTGMILEEEDREKTLATAQAIAKSMGKPK